MNAWITVASIVSIVRKLYSREIPKPIIESGRVLIRTSGTEPLVRVMIEGEDQEYITKKAKKIADLIEEKLG